MNIGAEQCHLREYWQKTWSEIGGWFKELVMKSLDFTSLLFSDSCPALFIAIKPFYWSISTAAKQQRLKSTSESPTKHGYCLDLGRKWWFISHKCCLKPLKLHRWKESLVSISVLFPGDRFRSPHCCSTSKLQFEWFLNAQFS